MSKKKSTAAGMLKSEGYLGTASGLFAKLAARQWAEVTRGSGVLLVDGKPVKPEDPERLVARGHGEVQSKS